MLAKTDQPAHRVFAKNGYFHRNHPPSLFIEHAKGFFDQFLLVFIIDGPLDHDFLRHHRPCTMPGAHSVLTGCPVLKEFRYLHDIFCRDFRTKSQKFFHILFRLWIFQVLERGEGDR